MIDALGFKGIWGRAQASAVIGKLQSLRQDLDRHLDTRFGGSPELRANLAENPGNTHEFVGAALLSDTIVLGFAMKPADILEARIKSRWPAAKDLPPTETLKYALDWHAIVSVSSSLASALKTAATTEPVLAYRGAITFGEFEIDRDGRFILGPGVDDAAQHAELAQGAFVWVTPKGLAAMERSDRLVKRDQPRPLIRYAVPMKGGLSLDTHVVSPFSSCQVVDELEQLHDALLKSFTGDSLDVAVKRQETEKFLKFAQERWKPPETSEQ